SDTPTTGDEDHQPVRKAVHAGQIVNARSLIEENDTVSSVGSAGFVSSSVPTVPATSAAAAAAATAAAAAAGAGSGDGLEGTSSGSSPGASPLGRGRVPGTSGKSGGGSVDRRNGGKPNKSSDNVALHVRDANKALAFETLLTTGATVKLSSTPDRLRTLEVQGARKNSVAASTAPVKYQAKEAQVNTKEDNSLSEFLKTTGPGDDLRTLTGGVGSKSKMGGDKAPLKGVLKSSTLPPIPPVPQRSSTSTSIPLPPTPSDGPVSPPMSRSSTSPSAIASPTRSANLTPRGGSSLSLMDDDDSEDDELFGRKKKKKDDMSLADFLKYSEPPPEASPVVVSTPSSPASTRRAKAIAKEEGGGGGGGPLRLFSLTRSRNNSGTTTPDTSGTPTGSLGRRSRQTSDASLTSSPIPSSSLPLTSGATPVTLAQPTSEESQVVSPRTRSASQSSMEKLVRGMFGGLNGGGGGGGVGSSDEDAATGAGDGTDPVLPPPVPVIPPEILKKHTSLKGSPTPSTPAATLPPPKKETLTTPTPPLLTKDTAPSPPPITVRRIIPTRFDRPAPASALRYVSVTGKNVMERFNDARAALGELDDSFKGVLGNVTEDDLALPVPGDTPPPPAPALIEYSTAYVQTGGETGFVEEVEEEERKVERSGVERVDMGSQTIFEVLVVEYEECLYGEGEEEEEEFGEVVVVEEEEEEEEEEEKNDGVIATQTEFPTEMDEEISKEERSVSSITEMKAESKQDTHVTYITEEITFIPQPILEPIKTTSQQDIQTDPQPPSPSPPPSAEPTNGYINASEDHTSRTAIAQALINDMIDHAVSISSDDDPTTTTTTTTTKNLTPSETTNATTATAMIHPDDDDDNDDLTDLLCEGCRGVVEKRGAVLVNRHTSPSPSPLDDDANDEIVYADDVFTDYDAGVRRRRVVVERVIDVRDGEAQTRGWEFGSEVGVQVCTLPFVPVEFGSGSPRTTRGGGGGGGENRFSVPVLNGGFLEKLRKVGASVSCQCDGPPPLLDVETQTSLACVSDVGVQAFDGAAEEREMERDGREAALLRRIRELEKENFGLRCGVERERIGRGRVLEALVGVVDLVLRRE
ncbi:hypothetical protein HDU67_000295, partial [Dinochytrium kinnereticum]